MKQFYRLVDPFYEKEGKEYNTMDTLLSPRMQHSIEMSPLFNIVFCFWQKTGVQLSTACDAMFNFWNYLETVQTIEEEGGEYVPTSLFNHHEAIQFVPFRDLKVLMFSYYDLYNEKHLSLDVEDLPYIWEFLWEVVRKNLFSAKNSRFIGLFLYDNLDQTIAFQNKINTFPPHNTIVKVKIENELNLERYDAGWLDNLSVNCTFNDYFESCKNYWLGEPSNNPNWEYIYIGKYKIEGRV